MGGIEWIRAGLNREVRRTGWPWQEITNLLNKYCVMIDKPSHPCGESSLAPRRILHLEDNEFDRQLLRETIMDYGIECEYVHAVSQQLQARRAHYEHVGAYLLGLEPAHTFI